LIKSHIPSDQKRKEKKIDHRGREEEKQKNRADAKNSW
jgi:hypothetical protein